MITTIKPPKEGRVRKPTVLETSYPGENLSRIFKDLTRSS